MRLKYRSLLFTAICAAAAGWNILCLLDIIELSLWPVSIGIIIAAALLAMQTLFSRSRGEEVSRHLSLMTTRDRCWMGVTVCLCASWLVTAASCIVTPG